MTDRIIVIDGNVKFELILDDTKISYVEESQRYKDSFSTKFTFPFEFHLDRDLKILMGDFSSINVANLKTYYDNCYHIVDGKIRNAKLKIMSATGDVIRAQIDSGFEEFPNWNKNLRDLPLGTVESNTDSMISVAEKTIDKSYPEVNYNFPMMHTELYKGDDSFSDFQGTINKRINGKFIENSKEIENNRYINANIVAPMVYWLHILKTGFEDAGFSLNGDVLENELLKNTLIVPSSKFELFNRPDTVEWLVGVESYKFKKYIHLEGSYITGVYLPGLSIEHGNYESEQKIELYGVFRVKGKGNARLYYIDTPEESYYPHIYFNDELVYKVNKKGTYEFEFDIRTSPGKENIIKYTSFDYKDIDDNQLEVKIIPLKIYDENGNQIQELANYDVFDLASNLPDKTFGHFVTTTKNLLNLDMYIKNDTEVWMNYIDNSFNSTKLEDISEFEVLYPEQNFNEDLSFLIQYKDVDEAQYKQVPIYYDNKGIQSQNFIKSENTKEILIDVFPLPIESRNGIRTAYQFKEQSDVYQIAVYDGLKNDENISAEIYPWELSRIFNQYWLNWLNFRVNTRNLKWKFLVNKNRWKRISILDSLYAYKSKLWIKRITKTSVNSKVYEIELECDIVKN